jgi:hypothetical protein
MSVGGDRSLFLRFIAVWQWSALFLRLKFFRGFVSRSFLWLNRISTEETVDEETRLQSGRLLCRRNLRHGQSVQRRKKQNRS